MAGPAPATSSPSSTITAASLLGIRAVPTKEAIWALMLLAAVKRVAAGGLAFDPEVLARETVSGRWRPLSRRERDVVRLVVEGCSNDDIGRRLGIARKTVESHLAHLFERYGVSSRAELAARAEREGWLYLPAT